MKKPTMKKPKKNCNNPNDEDLIRYGWAPGGYFITCSECKSGMDMDHLCDKRSIHCRACAVVKWKADHTLTGELRKNCNNCKYIAYYDDTSYWTQDGGWACERRDDRIVENSMPYSAYREKAKRCCDLKEVGE